MQRSATKEKKVVTIHASAKDVKKISEMLASFDPTHININNKGYNYMKSKRSFIAYLILKIITFWWFAKKDMGATIVNFLAWILDDPILT